LEISRVLSEKQVFAIQGFAVRANRHPEMVAAGLLPATFDAMDCDELGCRARATVCDFAKMEPLVVMRGIDLCVCLMMDLLLGEQWLSAGAGQTKASGAALRCPLGHLCSSEGIRNAFLSILFRIALLLVRTEGDERDERVQ
jgi:hypothetical protein